ERTRGGDRGGAPSPAADSDDVVRVHSRRAAVGAGQRRQFGRAALARYRGIQRHVERGSVGYFYRSGALRDDREARGTPASCRCSCGNRGGSPMKRTIVALSVLALTGCTMGPNYKRPQVAVPGQFRSAPTGATDPAASIADTKWQDLFSDQTLN